MEIIYSDGRREDHGKQADLIKLGTLQKIVGGYIEMIRLGQNSEYFIVINEDGIGKDLPINFMATRVCHEAKAIFAEDCIVGNAVILHNSEFD